MDFRQSNPDKTMDFLFTSVPYEPCVFGKKGKTFLSRGVPDEVFCSYPTHNCAADKPSIQTQQIRAQNIPRQKSPDLICALSSIKIPLAP